MNYSDKVEDNIRQPNLIALNFVGHHMENKYIIYSFIQWKASKRITRRTKGAKGNKFLQEIPTFR